MICQVALTFNRFLSKTFAFRVIFHLYLSSWKIAGACGGGGLLLCVYLIVVLIFRLFVKNHG